jgi:hypothetical protein
VLVALIADDLADGVMTRLDVVGYQYVAAKGVSTRTPVVTKSRTTSAVRLHAGVKYVAFLARAREVPTHP